MTFDLPRTHIDRDNTAWRQSPRSRSRTSRQKGEKSKLYRHRLARERKLIVKRGVLDGTIPSAISDTGASSSAALASDAAHCTATGRPSDRIFHVANGEDAPATEERELQHPLRKPACEIHVVPSLRGASLWSTSKLAAAGYVSVYDGDEVNVYDGRTARIHVSEAAVLQGWRCPRTGLWRIPLTAERRNDNVDTLLLDSPDGRGSLNAMYHVPHIPAMHGHIAAMRTRPSSNEAINHVYELPSVKPAIRYLHAAIGFPTKTTWLKAIQAGNFLF